MGVLEVANEHPWSMNLFSNVERIPIDEVIMEIICRKMVRGRHCNLCKRLLF